MPFIASLVDPIELIKALNTLSPLGVIGLLAYVIYMLVQTKKRDKAVATNLQDSVNLIGDNHLHEMPDLVEMARSLNQTMVRVEAQMQEMNNNIIYIRARMNGNSH